MIDGHYTGESNSVNVQLPGLSELLDRDASMVCVSVCDISKFGRRDEVMVSSNRIVVGTMSDMTPPVTAQDLSELDYKTKDGGQMCQHTSRRPN